MHCNPNISFRFVFVKLIFGLVFFLIGQKSDLKDVNRCNRRYKKFVIKIMNIYVNIYMQFHNLDLACIWQEVCYSEGKK